ncbi:MAG: LON peptidase substrate-binding domain-containing protein [Phycisphaerales bacterium]
MAEPVRVNFGRKIPLFPFRDVVLLPHETLPLHVFETRYRQMVGRCLDSVGQFAIATVDPDGTSESDAPALRPVVCVGQIIQHEPQPDGCVNLLLHGVCRARIRTLHEPDDDRLYRAADLAALDVDPDDGTIDKMRPHLRELLHAERLERLEAIETIRQWADHDSVPTRALIDLLGFVLVRRTEPKYALLAEADVRQRCSMVRRELERMGSLIDGAGAQSWRDWPKGMSWN